MMGKQVFCLPIVKSLFLQNSCINKNTIIPNYKNNESEKLKPFDSPYHVIGFNNNSLNYFLDKVELKVLKKRNFGRKFDFLSYSPKNKSFWINLFFLFPVEYPGQLIQRDIYFEVYLSRNN